MSERITIKSQELVYKQVLSIPLIKLKYTSVEAGNEFSKPINMNS